MATEIKSGWYGTEDSTYYVTPSGRVYLVQTDDTVDLNDGPRPVRGGLPAGVAEIDPVLLDDELCAAVEGLD